MATVSVRYIVRDVDAAIAFYCEHLGFTQVMHPAPVFAMLSRGDLRLLLSAPGGGPGGGQAMPDGTLPRPGGWNRFAIEVTDLAGTVENLSRRGVRFRSGIITGTGGKQIIADDPSGNPVELFEPTLPEARLGLSQRAVSASRLPSPPGFARHAQPQPGWRAREPARASPHRALTPVVTSGGRGEICRRPSEAVPAEIFPCPQQTACF